MNWIMICIKSINGLSNGKRALIQTQAIRHNKLFLEEKLKKFIIFCNVLIIALSRNPLDIFLDAQLIFEEHLKVITTNVNKTKGLFRKLHNILLRPALLTIYKAFVRPHLDYGEVTFDEIRNKTFHQKLEST